MTALARDFTRNLGFGFVSNATSLVVSIIVTLWLPRILGLTEYSYWQLYLFYFGFIGFFQFGWTDGMYLRYGGKQYEQLDKLLFQSQFISLLAFQICIALTAFFLLSFISIEPLTKFILNSVLFQLVIVGSRAFLFFVLLATGRMKEFAKIFIFDRLTFLVLILALSGTGAIRFREFVFADIIACLGSFLFVIVTCRDLAVPRFDAIKLDKRETIANIAVGLKVMLANIANLLILAIFRMGIINTWGIPTFGKISLALSFSNITLSLLNSLSPVLFPYLRRLDTPKLKRVYQETRSFFIFVMLVSLFSFYPIRLFLEFWLPTFRDATIYLTVIFPLFILEGKTSILTFSFLRTLRAESLILKINIFSVLISLVLTIVFTKILPNLIASVISMLLVAAVRSKVGEFYLFRLLKLKHKMRFYLEYYIIVVFVYSYLNLSTLVAYLLLAVNILLYLAYHMTDVRAAVKLFIEIFVRKIH